MAVKIRLARAGARNRPYYRIVVADARSPRNGRFIELVGTYDPCTNPPRVTIKSDRIDHWVGHGAQPTRTVSQLLQRARKDEPKEISQS
jgi:small subunit ribosomal protein S16